ncbi:MAG: AMP-binding protein [Pikeienuella sp.]
MTQTTFFADPDQRVDRDQLEALGAKGAGALAALGVQPDDVVAVIMRNDLLHIELMRAVALAGATLCPLNWHSAAQEVEAILSDCSPKAVLIHRDLVEPLVAVLAGHNVVAITPDAAITAAYSGDADAHPELPEWSNLRDAAEPVVGRTRMRPMLRYTSGSTGMPKGILRKHSDPNVCYYETLAKIGTGMMRMRDGGRFLTAAPLYHSAPSTLSGMALAIDGMNMMVLPRFEAESFLATIEAEKITHIYLVPTMMARLLKLPDDVKSRYDLSSIEFCISTGSPWPHEIKAAMIDWWGPVMWETYGASELGFLTLVNSEEALAKPNTAGTIQMGGSILILNENGDPLPAGEIGDIYIQFNHFGEFQYSNADDEAMRARGHVGVGDMGWLDEDGYLFIADRKKDMIISGGANIFPAEIEAALIEAPFVADVAVFGAPDPEFGERIVAAIQPEPGSSPDDAAVKEWLGTRLARFKHPRIVEFHDALPRHDSGKIFKQRLRAPHWEGSGRKI